MRFADLPPAPAHPLQSLVEFGALWEYVNAFVRPRNVVEVGSLFGGTLWYWLRLPTVEQVTSVDLVTADEPLREDVLAARAEWVGWTREVPARLRIVEADSHAPATLEHVPEVIDFLFLDGDHTYEGVKADHDLWRPRVRPGGVVAFHDTVINGTRNEPGVRRFVAELKCQWRILSVEFFDPDGAGITAFVV